MKKTIPVIIIVFLIIILGGVFALRLFLDKYSYSKETVDSSQYFGVEDPQDVPVMLQNELTSFHARMIGGTYYLDIDSVKNVLNDRFYVGKYAASAEEADVVLYCEPTERVMTVIGSNQWSSDSDGTVTENYCPAVRENGTVYLSVEFVKKFSNFTYQTFSEPNRMQLNTLWEDQQAAEVKKNTQIRITGGIKSEILREVEKGEEVIILEQMENWSKVRTDDCYVGYIENKRLSDPYIRSASAPVREEQVFTTSGLEGKVCLAWHAVAGTAGNDTIYSYLAQTKSLNVIAPTWFWILDGAGNISSFASTDYVEYLHGQGIRVWGTVDNFNSPGVDRNQFLTSVETRTNLINQLISQAEAFGLDGINVDFEQISAEYGEDFIEFIRELSIECRKRSLTLSVDNYVPYDFNDYYNLPEQGVFADYVIIMGYDEHYAGSTEAGSVASISYVQEGIARALQSVPASKLMNAVPFYTRVWSTTASGVTSQALGMADAQQYVSDHGLSVSWSDAAGQNYASSVSDTEKLEVWLEDAQSIQTKLSVMEVNSLAGVAAWRLGFETADVWDVIANYMSAGSGN